jgi:hypothetical protein
MAKSKVPLRKRLIVSAVMLPGAILLLLGQHLLALPFLLAGTIASFWLWNETKKAQAGTDD